MQEKLLNSYCQKSLVGFQRGHDFWMLCTHFYSSSQGEQSSLMYREEGMFVVDVSPAATAASPGLLTRAWRVLQPLPWLVFPGWSFCLLCGPVLIMSLPNSLP